MLKTQCKGFKNICFQIDSSVEAVVAEDIKHFKVIKDKVQGSAPSSRKAPIGEREVMLPKLLLKSEQYK